MPKAKRKRDAGPALKQALLFPDASTPDPLPDLPSAVQAAVATVEPGTYHWTAREGAATIGTVKADGYREAMARAAARWPDVAGLTVVRDNVTGPVSEPPFRYCKVCGCCDQVTTCNPPCRWLSLDVCTGCKDAEYLGMASVPHAKASCEVWRIGPNKLIGSADVELFGSWANPDPTFDHQPKDDAVCLAVGILTPGREPWMLDYQINPVSLRLAIRFELGKDRSLGTPLADGGIPRACILEAAGIHTMEALGALGSDEQAIRDALYPIKGMGKAMCDKVVAALHRWQAKQKPVPAELAPAGQRVSKLPPLADGWTRVLVMPGAELDCLRRDGNVIEGRCPVEHFGNWQFQHLPADGPPYWPQFDQIQDTVGKAFQVVTRYGDHHVNKDGMVVIQLVIVDQLPPPSPKKRRKK